ncbi:lectin-like domain-containing protein [Streptomyces sp. NBC_01465]|uniref:lectin-like domain-containing protein n=1 Tax=Streptomyces sp. NBC_01465 TaxID=2903878 RepID=UPI002E359789|nr:hypothetical protein [Streptomyces sp. NBC_01465]
MSRLSAPLGLVTAAAVGLGLVAPQAASARELGNEAFSGASVDGSKWFSSSEGADDPSGWACLTAAAGDSGPLKACPGGAVGDAAGKGALRLTGNKKNQNGFVVSQNAVPANAGLRLTADFAEYASKSVKPADGIAIMLLDGAASMPKTAGKFGGGLGYTGITGGYLGIGLDTYGNFITKGFGDGGNESGDRAPNSITVRGATSVKNPYISNYPSKRSLDVASAGSRQEAVRTVRVELSTAGRLSVAIDFHDGDGMENKIDSFDLNTIKNQPKMPSSLRIGLASGTGDYNEIHEIWNAKVESLDPKLSTKTVADGPVVAGQDATFTMTTDNDPTAGPTAEEVTTVQTFPKGITPTAASGDGWKCTVVGQTVTCKRPGTGADALQPAKSYPPVKVTTKTDASIKGDVPVTSSVSDADGKQQTPSTDLITVSPAKDPSLVVTAKPVGEVVGGQNATYQVDVTNKPDAGVTNGEVKVVRTFPAGITPVTAVGDGWTCDIAGQTVTCTRPGTGADALNAGSGYPPISIGTKVDEGAKGDLTGTTTASAGGNPGTPVKDTTTVKPAPVKDPSLSVEVKPEGKVVAGNPATFGITVSDAPTAGPTRDEVTVTRTFPAGVTPKSASGDGWKCSVNGQTVTCSRPGTGADALQPGKSYPPIKVVTDVDGKANGQLEGTTSVGTAGDPNSDNKVTDTFVVVDDPNADISCGGWIRSVCQ